MEESESESRIKSAETENKCQGCEPGTDTRWNRATARYIHFQPVQDEKIEDVTMELSNGYLSIKATHNTTDEEKDAKGNLVRSERNFGSCSRSFYVGDNIKAEDVKAKFENGMLQVTVPSAKQKQIESTETISIE